jgi:hypothetical protein
MALPLMASSNQHQQIVSHSRVMAVKSLMASSNSKSVSTSFLAGSSVHSFAKANLNSVLGGYQIFDTRWIRFSQNRLQKVPILTFLFKKKTLYTRFEYQYFYCKNLSVVMM